VAVVDHGVLVGIVTIAILSGVVPVMLQPTYASIR